MKTSQKRRAPSPAPPFTVVFLHHYELLPEPEAARPPLSLSRCNDAHVLEFLWYLVHPRASAVHPCASAVHPRASAVHLCASAIQLCAFVVQPPPHHHASFRSQRCLGKILRSALCRNHSHVGHAFMTSSIVPTRVFYLGHVRRKSGGVRHEERDLSWIEDDVKRGLNDTKGEGKGKPITW
ncbi:uncharacterized protein LOC109806526 [Cajanus cajan]|uniref:uncharacterized protein LOC109806526 n=1 Tax=Cajanus cajan TaxID=3821 RepID=UPI00098DB66E|nr:uncharacterized protein LOC109806526 [Cajanus cajan]